MTRPAAFAVLGKRDFALYVVAVFLATAAQQIQAVALGWQIYALTGDPFDLGLVGLAEFVPAAGLALVTGPLADRFDRRRMALLGIAGELAAALFLVVITLSGRASVPAILAAALIFGAGRAVVWPATRALMANLLPAEALASGVAWNSAAWQVASIGGPALGGLLYVLDASVPYFATALALAGALAATAALVPPPRAVISERMDLAAAFAGLRLIFRHRLLLGVISLDLFAVLFSGAAALLPVFAKDVLLIGPAGLGLLRSAPAVGAVATALALTHWPLARRAGKGLFAAVGMFGAAVVLFGLSRDVALSMAALLVMGAADMVSVYVRGTLVPLATPDRLRGRVLAVESVFIGASNELGAFVAGSAAALLGPVVAVVGGGGMTLLVTLLWYRLFPSLAAVERMEDLAYRGDDGEDRVGREAGKGHSE